MSIFSRFLGHHVRDITQVASAIATIASKIPLDSEEKTKVKNAVDFLNDSIVNIVDSKEKVGDVYSVVPDNVTIREIIKEELPAIVRQVITDLATKPIKKGR